MAGGKSTEKEILKKLDAIPLREGQIRYLVASSWFNQWKDFVESPQNLEPPSTIDNSSLLNDSNVEDTNQVILRPLLLEKRDFVIVSEGNFLNELVTKILKTFGKVSLAFTVEDLVIYLSHLAHSSAIPKKVIVVGEHKQPVVEIYPLYIKIFHSKENEADVILSFSKVSTVKELLSQTCKSLSLDEKIEYTLWDFLGRRKKIKIDTSNAEATLDEVFPLHK